MSSTFVAPCDRLYAQLPAMDLRDGVCDSNLMIGYVWADSPRATAAAVVTATDAGAGKAAARDIARSYHAARDELVFDMPAAPLELALDQLAGRPAILADSGDNPTAGGVGDRADCLAAVQARGLSGVLFAGIAAPMAFDQLAGGAKMIRLGGALGGGGPVCDVRVDHCRIYPENAVVESGGITIVVTQKRRPFHQFGDFAALGLTLDDFTLLVVKSGYLSPDLRTLDRVQMMALTDGAVCQNLDRLTNEHRPAGTWPFDRADPED